MFFCGNRHLQLVKSLSALEISRSFHGHHSDLRLRGSFSHPCNWSLGHCPTQLKRSYRWGLNMATSHSKSILTSCAESERHAWRLLFHEMWVA